MSEAVSLSIAPLPHVSVAPPPEAPLSPGLAPGEPPKDDLKSSQFAAIAKKEAFLVKEKQEIARIRASVQKDQEEAQNIRKKAEQFEEMRKTDPVAALKLIGFNETEIFNFLSAQEKKELTPEEKTAQIAAQTAEEKFNAYKKEQEEAQSKVQQAQDQKALGEFKKNLGGFVQANKEKYKFCTHFGEAAVEQAYLNVIEAAKESNFADIPTIQEAMDDLEWLYHEQYKAMKSVYEPKVEEIPEMAKPKEAERTRTVETPPGSTPPNPTITRQRTITNAATTSTRTATGQPRWKNESEKKEYLARALAAGGLHKLTSQ